MSDLEVIYVKKYERPTVVDVQLNEEVQVIEVDPTDGADIDASLFATAAQGAKADTALQPGSITGAGAISVVNQVVSIAPATTSAPGSMSILDKIKLDGIAPGATANSLDAQLRDRSTHTGQQPSSTISDLPAAVRALFSGSGAVGYNNSTGVISLLNATTSAAGAMSATDKIKLDGIAAGATVNSSDAQLRDRSTHTGTQLSNTISDFVTASRNLITGNGAIVYDNVTGAFSLADATPSAAGAMSAADKIKLNGIAIGATANATDAQLRDRSTHTGTQLASSISDLATAVGALVPNINSYVELTQPSAFDDYLALWDASASANVKVRPYQLPPINPSRYLYVFDDYFNSVSNTYIAAINGTSAAVSLFSYTTPPEANTMGWAQLSTGTTNTGRAALYNAVSIQMGNGKWYFRTRARINTALSDGTETYTLRAGLNSNSFGEGPNAVMFRYTHSVNSGNWQCVTRANNNETVLNTAVAAVLNTSVVLEFMVNANSTSVEFWIDGVSQGTITTNIPSGGSQLVGSQPMFIFKSVGTGARTVLVDYSLLLGELAVAR